MHRVDDLRAVLWDMDGTLLDSAEYHWLAWRETLAGEGIDLTRERFAETFGQRNDTILRGYFGAEIAESELKRISEAKEQRYRDLIRARGIVLLPGAKRWLTYLHSAGWRQALASSAPQLNIETILAALEIDEYFDAIVAAEDVERGKPDPEVFLTAAARVGVPAERCIVVEDAPAGIEAARRAGMRTIGVLTTNATLVADLVVPTLDDLAEDAFECLLDRR